MGIFAVSTMATAQEAEQPWIVDRFDDIKVIRYEVPGFENLTAKEKEYVYYLTEAAKCGRDILFDQTFKYGLAVRRSFETIYTEARNTAEAEYKTALEQQDVLEERKPATYSSEITLESYIEQMENISKERDRMSVEKGKTEEELKIDDKARERKQDTTELDRLEAEMEKWKSFSKHFGNADGSDLNMIAQSFVLGSLIKSANHHLKSMEPRYKLLVTPGKLVLKLEDEQNCYATRNTNSISGGESFLVSLALAPALADFGSHLGVSTLFIDEGFGTLSGGPLQSAINTLKALHSDAGRQVGIISHRKEVSESIPVQVAVTPVPGTSASRIEVGENIGAL